MSLQVTAIVLLYLLITLALGILGYRATSKTAEDYFIASRTIGSLVFFFTMVATQYSGFAVFGVSGIAYRSGFAAYEWSLLGNGFVPIFLYVIGYPIWLLGKRKGYVTPTEYFADRFQSESLKLIILAIWVLFNLPFLAIQWVSAGYTLAGLSKGQIPFSAGVIFLTAFTIVYVYLGGMKSVAWTDTFQGIVMFAAFTISSVVIVQNLGGLSESLGRLYREHPDFFSRPGGDGSITRSWGLGTVLIGISAFMAPQLLTRFYVPKSENPFKVLSVMWLPAVFLLSFPVVLVGSLGRLSLPNLVGRQSDEVFTMLLGKYTPPVIQAIFSGGILAALMSTASSVLLVLSSFVTRDLYLRYVNKTASSETQVKVGRACVLVIGTISCLLALRSNSTLFNLLVYAFSAFAMVLPTAVAALYWKRATAWGCMAGILCGLSLLLGAEKLFPGGWAGGLPPLVPAFGLNCVLLVVVSLLTGSPAQVAVGEQFLEYLSEAGWRKR